MLKKMDFEKASEHIKKSKTNEVTNISQEMIELENQDDRGKKIFMIETAEISKTKYSEAKFSNSTSGFSEDLKFLETCHFISMKLTQ